jgi:hypothetical protein
MVEWRLLNLISFVSMHVLSLCVCFYQYVYIMRHELDGHSHLSLPCNNSILPSDSEDGWMSYALRLSFRLGLFYAI